MKLTCPTCEGAPSASLREHVAPFNSQKYTLHECSSCQLQFWFPLKILPEFYRDSDHEAYEQRHMGKSSLHARHILFLNRFAKKSAGRKLLDVGCADGSFLLAAKELGFEVWGLDLDSRSIEAARARGLENVISMTLEEFSATHPEQKFDVLTAFEVLEHQDDPNLFIDQIQMLLRKGGAFVGSVPDRDRPLAERTRVTSMGDFPPHHFLWFSQSVLRDYLTNRGFLEVETFPLHTSFQEMGAYFEYNLAGSLTQGTKKRLSVGNAEKNTNRRDGLRAKRGFNLGAILRAARTGLFLPVSLALRHRGRGVAIYFEGTIRSGLDD